MSGDRPAPQASAARFFAAFALFAALGFAIQVLPWVDRHLIAPWLEFMAAASAVLAAPFGGGLQVDGAVLQHPSGYAVRVANGCSGVEAVILLTAAMLAFPATARARLVGVLLGGALLLGVNVLRVLSLLYVGVHRPDWFDFIHLHLWDLLILLDSVLLFVLWVRWSGAPPRAAPA